MLIAIMNCDLPMLMREAIPLKKWFRNGAYDLAFIKLHFCQGAMKEYTYEVDIDGKSHDMTSSMMSNWSTSHQGEFGYNHPFCAVNDGLMEI